MASYTVSCTSSAIQITVSGLSTGNSVRYYARESSGTTSVYDQTFTATGSSLTQEIAGLKSNTEYAVNVQINGGSFLGAKYVTPQVSFSITETTTTTAWMSVTNLRYGDSVRIYARESSGTTGVFDQTFTATGTTLTQNISGLSPNTSYLANVLVNGGLFASTSYAFTTKAIQRPGDWAWWSTVSQEEPIKLTAAEWNRFCTVINEFRLYKNLSEYSFTTVYSGTAISASIVNQAYTAINAISGHGTMPGRAYAGNDITAYFFNQLKNALNAIS